MIAINAGIALNEPTCVRGMAICKPRAVPSVKRPRCWPCRAARCKRGARTKSVSMRVPGGEFFQSVPGLACLHRLVLAFHVVFVALGAGGIRLVCLFLRMTGLNRFVGASFGMQQRINRQVEEAMVAYTREETPRLAQAMSPKAITVTQDETFPGGLCLVAMEPVSNDLILEQTAQARAQDTWQDLMDRALAALQCQGIQSTSDEAPGL